MKHFARPAAAGLIASALALAAAGAWAQDKVTLRVWDSFTENTDGMDAMIAAFEAANPTIDVERDVQATEDMRAIIQTALNSGTGPDVFSMTPVPALRACWPRPG
jgi:raffinose/stachyose/melibiose transport system substrate-binding protein